MDSLSFMHMSVCKETQKILLQWLPGVLGQGRTWEAGWGRHCWDLWPPRAFLTKTFGILWFSSTWLFFALPTLHPKPHYGVLWLKSVLLLKGHNKISLSWDNSTLTWVDFTLRHHKVQMKGLSKGLYPIWGIISPELITVLWGVLNEGFWNSGWEVTPLFYFHLVPPSLEAPWDSGRCGTRWTSRSFPTQTHSCSSNEGDINKLVIKWIHRSWGLSTSY